MLLNQILNPKPTAYSDAIAEATGAHRMELPIIERIMREVIFHSTLDWQSKEQFNAGAVEAYQEYKASQGFYDAENKFYLHKFHLAKTDEKLTAALLKLERVTIKGPPERIAKCRAEVEKLRSMKTRLTEKAEFYKKLTATMSRLYAGEPIR